jgi:hypothetical protein
METKVCTKCEVEKPLEEFGKCSPKNPKGAYKDGRTYACRACHNDTRRKWCRDNRAKSNDINTRYQEKNPEFYMWCAAKARAKRRGTPFTIKRSDIHIPEVCPVLGIPLTKGKGVCGPNSPSLDAIVPELGYVPGNIVVMSHKANTIKSNADLKDLELVVSWLKQL